MKIILKNSIFEASNAFGAMMEIEKNFTSEMVDKPIVVISTDGGGEHNLSFPSVQAALVAFFLNNSDIMNRLLAMNSAPYHSFANPVERCMCIINLALYNVALVITSSVGNNRTLPKGREQHAHGRSRGYCAHTTGE